MTSVCPRCASPREERDGPYFVCAGCRWCWTVSVTGKVYVQSAWPRVSHDSAEDDGTSERMVRRLLGTVDGLPEKLAGNWPERQPELGQQPFSASEVERLRAIKAATAADYFNEGVPGARLRAEGVQLPPPAHDDASS